MSKFILHYFVILERTHFATTLLKDPLTINLLGNFHILFKFSKDFLAYIRLNHKIKSKKSLQENKSDLFNRPFA